MRIKEPEMTWTITDANIALTYACIHLDEDVTNYFNKTMFRGDAA